MTLEGEKRAAAEYAAGLVEDGMRVGLGTGTTVAPLIPALAARGLRLRCVATSEATARAAEAAGLTLDTLDGVGELDIAIDGADQIAPGPWLIKGGGRAHTREKLVAAAAARFVVIASHDKPVPRLTPPVPLELLAFGLEATLRRLEHAVLRGGAKSPDGGVIADWTGPIDDPAQLARRLEGEPGVVDHGLFAPTLVTDVVVATGEAIDHTRHWISPGSPPRRAPGRA
ncbi:ribose 5-phosphate isomerase A [Solirubrobacter pauli]|uniref:ribose 5-phosphate isomerase A n=1 Tax=Solirubrobacter pauli TaxID=166793 RepID=UPI001B884424|nr:ribose 5-phosphate isomerase A [Solirubrobacter pauli]